MWDFGFLGLIFMPYFLAFVFWFLPLYCLTLLLYIYKPHYVNLALHIGVWGVLYCFIVSFQYSIFDRNGLLWIVFIQEIPHLAFTLYAMIYARKFDIQKIPFRKRLQQYLASFFIGIGLLILSFVVMFIVGYCVVLLEMKKRTLVSLVLYITFLALPALIILSLLSHIFYKNHKSFFTKIFDRICAMIGKGKS